MRTLHESPRSRRAGLTLLETLLGLTLLALVAQKAYTAFKVASEVTTTEMSNALVEDQARKVLRQICYAVMSSHRDSLDPARSAPFDTDDLRYQIHLGVQDGEIVWSPPELISLEEASGQVVWTDDPDAALSRRVVWSNLVAPFLEGELPNGIDDNGNGLIDERGLSFTVDRNAVTIRLTLEREMDDGRTITKTVQTTVTCRNLVGGM